MNGTIFLRMAHFNLAPRAVSKKLAPTTLDFAGNFYLI